MGGHTRMVVVPSCSTSTDPVGNGSCMEPGRSMWKPHLSQPSLKNSEAGYGQEEYPMSGYGTGSLRPSGLWFPENAPVPTTPVLRTLPVPTSPVPNGSMLLVVQIPIHILGVS